MQFAGRRRPVPLPDRLRRLPDVRGDVGPALPRRDRPGRGGPRRRSRSPSGATPRTTERAFRRRPLTLEHYFAAPFVVEPFRADDCTVEVDGACAVLVTSRRAGPRPAAIRRRSSPRARYRAGPRPGLDIGDHLLWDDYTRNYTSLLATTSTRRPASDPADVQLRRDLRLLHQHGADRPRRPRALRPGGVRAPSSARAAPGSADASRPTPTAACWPRATCTA